MKKSDLISRNSIKTSDEVPVIARVRQVYKEKLEGVPSDQITTTSPRRP